MRYTIGLVVYDEIEHADSFFKSLSLEKSNNQNVSLIVVINHPENKFVQLWVEKFKFFNEVYLFDHFEVYHNPHNNIATSRNFILNKCQTDFLYFTDPDMTVKQSSIQSLIHQALELNDDSIYGWTGPVIHQSNNRLINKIYQDLQQIHLLIPSRFCLSFQIQNYLNLKKINHAPTCHLLLRKQHLKNKNLSFDSSFSRVGEDLFLSQQITNHKGKYLFAPEAVAIQNHNLNFLNWMNKIFHFGQAQTVTLIKSLKDFGVFKTQVRWGRLIPMLMLPPMILFWPLLILMGLINSKIYSLLLTTLIYGAGEWFGLFALLKPRHNVKKSLENITKIQTLNLNFLAKKPEIKTLTRLPF